MRNPLRCAAKTSRGARGQSLVELALTLPIMTTVLVGVIDLSFVLYAHVQVAAAAGEAARAGALFTGDLILPISQNDANRSQAIRDAVYNASMGTTAMGMLKTSSPNFDVTSDVQVSYDPAWPVDPLNTVRSGDQVVVTITYRQPLLFYLLPGQVSHMLTVATTSRMRIQ